MAEQIEQIFRATWDAGKKAWDESQVPQFYFYNKGSYEESQHVRVAGYDAVVFNYELNYGLVIEEMWHCHRTKTVGRLWGDPRGEREGWEFTISHYPKSNEWRVTWHVPQEALGK